MSIGQRNRIATATQRIEWVPVITGVVSTILFLVLLIYAAFYFLSRFYGCDCGDESPFFGSKMVQSDDQLWKDFGKCKIKTDRNLSNNITYITAVKALDGKEVTISGFMQPLEAKDESSHFLLSKNAPTCAYCPPSRPNEIVEVFSSKPMAWKENLITLSGTLMLVNDGKKSVFSQIKNAIAK